MAARRRELKAYQLGPDHPAASTRFNAAVNRLVEAGRRHVPPAQHEPGAQVHATRPPSRRRYEVTWKADRSGAR
jgi:hypothetical protein